MSTSVFVPQATPPTSHELAKAIPLDEAANLLAGDGAWHFPGIPSLGIAPFQVADCGHGITLVHPPYGCATCFPTSVGMAATWNISLIEEVGRALGRESLAKGLGMLLAPMVNLHRLPCGGRNYETFSEDPVLAGRLAAALIRGIQSEGVSACVKSFACNNQQLDQQKISAEVDPRTLRELYLKAFAIAIKEGSPWAVMTSYNAINGEYPADSHLWLESVLREEMGYDGFVVSDWHAVRSDGALSSGLDLEMPGPGKRLNKQRVLAALQEGVLTEEDLRRRVSRLIDLHAKVRPKTNAVPRNNAELDSPRHRDLARRVAEQSLVLLQNTGEILPFNQSKVRRIAVIGPNAATARLGGGGSASVLPFYSVSPLAGIREIAAEAGIEVLHVEGCSFNNEPPVIPSSAFAPPDGAFGDGLHVSYYSIESFEKNATAGFTRIDPSVDFSWGWAAPAKDIPRHLYAARWTGRVQFPIGGQVRLSISTQQGLARVWLDGRLVLDAWSSYDPALFEDKFTNRHASATIDVLSGQEANLVCEYRKTGSRAAVRIGWELPGSADGIADAERIASAADVVVVCAGLSNMFEGGTCDRQSHEMPGQQVELIRRVAAVNPRTVVVLTNGTPVAMGTWRDQVAGILETFYPGQEGGRALARILFGQVNPSGRLPDTLPKSWDQVAAMRYYPGAGGLAPHTEGMHVGYRDADANNWDPEFPFGFGLSYTRFDHTTPVLSKNCIRPGESIQITVNVSNIGERDGDEVVQAYLEPIDRPSDCPPRALFAFEKVNIPAGASRTVTLQLSYSELLTYNPEAASWMLETTRFRIVVGPHSRALQRTAELLAKD